MDIVNEHTRVKVFRRGSCDYDFMRSTVVPGAKHVMVSRRSLVRTLVIATGILGGTVLAEHMVLIIKKLGRNVPAETASQLC